VTHVSEAATPNALSTLPGRLRFFDKHRSTCLDIEMCFGPWSITRLGAARWRVTSAPASSRRAAEAAQPTRANNGVDHS
jgi:hypothetical protein